MPHCCFFSFMFDYRPSFHTFVTAITFINLIQKQQMITDSMSKTEVMRSIRKEFDSYCYPAFKKEEGIVWKKSKEILRQKPSVNERISFRPTPNGLKFELFLLGTRKTHTDIFYLPFVWRKRHCYAVLSDNGAVDVFQYHALARYSERVLEDRESEEGLSLYEQRRIFERIFKRINNRFSIILPTPTHPLSHYFAAAGALFLGDYDPNIDDRFFWHNTCLSPKQMKNTQSRIVKVLDNLATAIDSLNFNPFQTTSEEQEEEIRMADHLSRNPGYRKLYLELLEQELLLLSLAYRFDLPEKQVQDTDLQMAFLKKKLMDFGVNPDEYVESNKDVIYQMAAEIAFRG